MFVHRSKKQLLGVVVAAVAAANCASSASAVLLGYEGFNYADGTSILNQTGGAGWSTAWTKTGNAASSENATTPGLSYSTLPVIGNKVTLIGQQIDGNGNSAFLFRELNASFGADGSTAWISFIGQRTGDKAGTAGAGGTATYQRIFGLSFFDGSNASETFSIGELTSSATVVDPDTWALNVFPTDLRSPSTAPIDQQSFLLVRVDYGAGSNADNAYLWVNPNLGLGPPSIGSANATLTGQNLAFDRLRVSAGGSQSTGAVLAASGLIDEIRVGTDFASVVSSSIVAGLGDVNGNGVVDINDYIIIRNNFQMTGATWDNGDLSGDGIVNLIDFRIWKDNRNAGAGAGTTTVGEGTVPEPSSTVLALVALLAFASRSRFKLHS